MTHEGHRAVGGKISGPLPLEALPLGEGHLRRTPSLLPLAERLALAAAHNVTMFLTGETGTGKPHLAGLIHAQSPRRRHPPLGMK